MPSEYTVSLVDTSGETPTVVRTNSYDSTEAAIEAAASLGQWTTFENERIEIAGAVGEPLTKTPHYWTPSVGDVVKDANPPDWSEDNRIRVTEVTETPASIAKIEDDKQRTPWETAPTVAEKNPGEPGDAPVVKGEYVAGSDTEYSFPVTRLEQ